MARGPDARVVRCGRPAERQRQVRHRRAGAGVNGQPVNGRCGPGVRIPLVVISPYAKQNYVDHTMIAQASVVRFIEDNSFLHTQTDAPAR